MWDDKTTIVADSLNTDAILDPHRNKQRVVRVGNRALLALASYIDEHRGKEVRRLFLSDEG